MMINAKIQGKLGWNPPLASIVLEAAEKCPEPEGLKVRFMFLKSYFVYLLNFFFKAMNNNIATILS